jgi:hypothetical protein
MGVLSADYMGLSTTYYLGAEGGHVICRPGGVAVTIALGMFAIFFAYWVMFRVRMCVSDSALMPCNCSCRW